QDVSSEFTATPQGFSGNNFDLVSFKPRRCPNPWFSAVEWRAEHSRSHSRRLLPPSSIAERRAHRENSFLPLTKMPRLDPAITSWLSPQHTVKTFLICLTATRKNPLLAVPEIRAGWSPAFRALRQSPPSKALPLIQRESAERQMSRR